MRSKRLIFGAKSSQDLFDQTMFRIFGDIPKCLNQRDDILLGGRNLQEHNRTLEQVLQRAADFGITFNREKCQFAYKELEFYGYRFTHEGLKPAEDKVRAVKQSKAPESKEAVRSFLGMIGYLSKFIPRYAMLTAPLRVLTHDNTKFRWGAAEQEAFEKLKGSITSEDTMVYFDPARPIIVRTEASFNEGLAAGLFQQTSKGVQPVHFISRSMTDTEKRYSQTEKDALAIRWAKNRFSMYLLGAPRFRIITAHKPLLPMFNKATSKVPPRIEKWIMDMQDVDFELVYEPGRDAADPLDFLSRHPLPETGHDSTEKMIKQVVATEHAVVLSRIQEETERDPQLQNLTKRIQLGDWEKHRKDADIEPYYAIREDMYIAEKLIFRLEKIVIPTSLQQKVVKAAHSLGHFGITKTKQMLREKYWFPKMNSLVEEMIRKCFECQVTTRQHRSEPVKIRDIPETPWDTVSIDFGGPYPDGHYNLVAIDKRTRYPEVEQLRSIDFKHTRTALKKIFATHGTPRAVESDNGAPFSSRDFASFAEEEGFHHHRITPLHPRANGEAESFMKILNKTEQIAHLKHQDIGTAIQDMLIGFRSTPHPGTGVTPYEGMMNRRVRIKLDHTSHTSTSNDRAVDERDRQYKEKLKRNAENRNTKEHTFKVNNYVLLKKEKKNKWSTAFEPAFYIIYKIEGSAVSARRVTDGREISRDASEFKLANTLVDEHGIDATREQHDASLERNGDDWRERLLRRTRPHRSDADRDANNAMGHNNNASNQGRADIDAPNITGENNTASSQDRAHRNRREQAYLRDYIHWAGDSDLWNEHYTTGPDDDD